jgi:hypothetical protein
VGGHHAKGFLYSQVKGTAATRHQAPGLHVALLDPLACLYGGGPQLLQLLLRGVVGRLEGLCLGRRVPKSVPQA